MTYECTSRTCKPIPPVYRRVWAYKRLAPAKGQGAPYWLLSRYCGPRGLSSVCGVQVPHAGYLYPQYPHWGNLDQLSNRISVWRYNCLFFLLSEIGIVVDGGILPRVCAHKARDAAPQEPPAGTPVFLVSSLRGCAVFASGYVCTLVRPGRGG